MDASTRRVVGSIPIHLRQVSGHSVEFTINMQMHTWEGGR
jgi:hypothetical protein